MLAKLKVQPVGITGTNGLYSPLEEVTLGDPPVAFPYDDGDVEGGDVFEYSKGVYVHIVNDTDDPIQVVFAGVSPCNQDHIHHVRFRIDGHDDLMVSSFPSELLDSTIDDTHTRYIRVGLLTEGGGGGGGGLS